jgi:hypothetical protein
MTREAFIEVLKGKGYSYREEGDKIVVTCEKVCHLPSLTSLPSGVEFKNGRQVNLRSLTSLPSGVKFNNGWQVDLRSLTSLPPGVEFNNQVGVYLDSLIGDSFHHWRGNIEGIKPNRILNKMIKDGVFER